jgi:hypothetical protein
MAARRRLASRARKTAMRALWAFAVEGGEIRIGRDRLLPAGLREGGRYDGAGLGGLQPSRGERVRDRDRTDRAQLAIGL